MQYLFALIFLLFQVSVALAERQMSLNDAERIFLENNLELKIKKSELGRYDAEVIGAGIIPNPSVKYSIASVKNSERETEETFAISQSMDIVSKRGLRITSAQKKREAQYLLYEQDVLSSLTQLKQVYYRALLLRENSRAMKDILNIFVDIENKTGERFRAGDISEAQYIKISAERGKFSSALEGILSELKTEIMRLNVLLNMDETDIAVKDVLYYKPVALNLNELQTLAKKRADIKAQSLFVNAAETGLSLSKRERIMPIEIEAGYRKRTGGFEGFVFGVSVPIPLFDRNQSAVASANAGLRTEKLKEEQIRKAVINEVRNLFEKLTALNARIMDLSEQLKMSREITRIASIAYEEGEATVMEMLDAFRSETEMSMEYNNALYNYHALLFEMERAAGTNLTKNGGNK